MRYIQTRFPNFFGKENLRQGLNDLRNLPFTLNDDPSAALEIHHSFLNEAPDFLNGREVIEIGVGSNWLKIDLALQGFKLNASSINFQHQSDPMNSPGSTIERLVERFKSNQQKALSRFEL